MLDLLGGLHQLIGDHRAGARGIGMPRALGPGLEFPQRRVGVTRERRLVAELAYARGERVLTQRVGGPDIVDADGCGDARRDRKGLLRAGYAVGHPAQDTALGADLDGRGARALPGIHQREARLDVVRPDGGEIARDLVRPRSRTLHELVEIGRGPPDLAPVGGPVRELALGDDGIGRRVRAENRLLHPPGRSRTGVADDQRIPLHRCHRHRGPDEAEQHLERLEDADILGLHGGRRDPFPAEQAGVPGQHGSGHVIRSHGRIVDIDGLGAVLARQGYAVVERQQAGPHVVGNRGGIQVAIEGPHEPQRGPERRGHTVERPRVQVLPQARHAGHTRGGVGGDLDGVGAGAQHRMAQTWAAGLLGRDEQIVPALARQVGRHRTRIGTGHHHANEIDAPDGRGVEDRLVQTVLDLPRDTWRAGQRRHEHDEADRIEPLGGQDLFDRGAGGPPALHQQGRGLAARWGPGRPGRGLHPQERVQQFGRRPVGERVAHGGQGTGRAGEHDE